MNWKTKTVGVLGFGAVGRSAVRFFLLHGARVLVMDANPQVFGRGLAGELNGAEIIEPYDTARLIDKSDFVIPSPGIDTRVERECADQKFLSELDVFHNHWHGPIVAVTGSIGKTSLVKLLEHLIGGTGRKVVAGGNVGVPMLDLIAGDTSQIAIIEVSSFQAELCKSFVPDIAVITNLYANHLDRHGSFEGYVAAKRNLVARMGSKGAIITNSAVISLMGLDVLGCRIAAIDNPRVGDEIIKYENSGPIFGENIDYACVVLKALKIDLNAASLASLLGKFVPLSNRVEYVGSVGGVDFYNDSKATVVQAAVRAAETMHSRSTILILGGTSKGVSRADIGMRFKGKVRKVVCFGAEAEELFVSCRSVGIESYKTSQLDEAVTKAFSIAKPGWVVLLSPAGASFDLFKNYEERGDIFRRIVVALPGFENL